MTITPPQTLNKRTSILIVVLAASIAGFMTVRMYRPAQIENSEASVSFAPTPSRGELEPAKEDSAINPAPTLPDSAIILDEAQARVLKLIRGARNGDSASMRDLAKEHQQCAQFTARPLDFERQIDELANQIPDRQVAEAMRLTGKRIAKRCQRLSLWAPELGRHAQRLLEAAASRGDLLAAIRLAGTSPTPIGEEQWLALVEQAISSDNPDAILEFANMVGLRAPTVRGRFEEISGSELWSHSWAIAACEMGASCQDPYLLENTCLSFFSCGHRSYGDFLRNEAIAGADRMLLDRNIRAIRRATLGERGQ